MSHLRSPVRSPERFQTTLQQQPQTQTRSSLASDLLNQLRLGTPTQLQPSQQYESASQNGGSGYASPPLAPRSIAAGAFDASNPPLESDVSRVQLLLRLLELEKRVNRCDDRSRMADENTKQRLTELSSSNAMNSERAATLLTRLSEVELAAREAEIGVQALEQKANSDADAFLALKNLVHSWREESKRELREEFQKNINLRNATHHQELVSLMDKQQEQQTKLIRAHELTSQGVHTKLHALEAKWNARYENVEQRLERQAEETQLYKDKAEQYELKLKEMQHQIQSSIEQAIAPIQQQLTLLTQLHEQQAATHSTQLQNHYTQLQTHASQITTIHAQLEYASTHLQEKCSALDQTIQQVKATQQSIQHSMQNVSDSMASSLNSLKEILPTRSDLASVEARMTTQLTHFSENQTGFESHVNSSLTAVEQQVQTELSRTLDELRTQLKELREEQVTPISSDVTTLKASVSDCTHQIEQQRKIVRRTTHSIQLVEEQLAAIQAKVLVASETAPFQHLPTSPIINHNTLARSYATNGFSSPPPVPYQSPFQPIALNMHLSDAAGLKVSPTRSTSGASYINDAASSYRTTRTASPQHFTRMNSATSPLPSQRTMNGISAEEEFVANFVAAASK